MSLQYLADDSGKTTGVFIPITEWNALKEKYADIEQLDILEWQVAEVRERMVSYSKNPESAEDFTKAIDDIEKTL